MKWELFCENEYGYQAWKLKDKKGTYAYVSRMPGQGFDKRSGKWGVKIEAYVENGRITLSSIGDDVKRMKKIAEALVNWDL